MTVLVTDGNQRATLAVVRSLGKLGIGVTVGETSIPSLASSSRHCVRAFQYPSPLTSEREFTDVLTQELDSGRHEVFLPMTDVACRIAAELAPRFPQVTIPLPSPDILLRTQDKGAVVDAARQVGLSCPKTYTVQDRKELKVLSQTLAYPVVVKPRFSVYRADGRWLRTQVQYAHSSEDLMSRYVSASAQVANPLIQELVPGDGMGVFLLMWDGELKAAMCHRRIREKPPTGGVSVLRETIAPDPRLVSASEALLKQLGWQGAAMVEFKGDKDPCVMEINGRFWGSLQLAIDAGMDFPAILYRLCCGETISPSFEYRVGVKSRWLAGDLDHLLLRLRNGHAVSRPLPSRARAAAEFLRFYERDTFYEIERTDDPGPAYFEWKRYASDLLASLRRAPAVRQES
ncbi:MAG: ATP-grasp domain-containing protein [Candidatus Korobacteraceae bacterium]